MDVSDTWLWSNREWDPSYLSSIFDKDFYDFNDLWLSNINDMELLEAGKDVERYCPIVEDISMDDHEFCSTVERIEEE